MKSAIQLKTLIGNMAKEKGLQHEILLRHYMHERFLKRVSKSKYSHQFVLKGGLLIADMIGINARSTKDLDATIRGFSLTEENLTRVLNEIIAVPVDDNIKMSLFKLERIRDEADYPGIRVTIKTSLDKTRQNIIIDLTSGDVITPGEVEYVYKPLFEADSINIKAYNTETVLAEKLETILEKSTATTRMKDYYDLYALDALKAAEINWELFNTAFKNTAESRGSYHQLLEVGHENIEAIKQSENLAGYWNRYQQAYHYATGLKWDKVLVAVVKIYNTLVLR
jgi:predicted nucleotidyltransferase component of viral defense system